MSGPSRDNGVGPARVIFCAALLLCVGAFVSGGTPFSGGGDEQRYASSYLDDAVALPLDPYIHDPVAAQKKHAEYQMALKRCVEREDGQYEPIQFAEPRLPRLYGAIDSDEVRKYGYRIPEGAPYGGLSSFLREIVFSQAGDAIVIRDQWGNVLSSHDPESCYSCANTHIMPMWIEEREIQVRLDQYVSDSVRRAEEDHRVTEGWNRWSDCMATRGYDFADPWAKFYSVWPGDGPSKREIAIAQADVACKHSSSLLFVWSSAIADVQDEILHTDPQAREDWERWMELNAKWSD